MMSMYVHLYTIYRYTAYRQLARYCWGWGGWEGTFESCYHHVLKKIRDTFPSWENLNMCIISRILQILLMTLMTLQISVQIISVSFPEPMLESS